jgi:hypothetical protein
MRGRRDSVLIDAVMRLYVLVVIAVAAGCGGSSSPAADAGDDGGGDEAIDAPAGGADPRADATPGTTDYDSDGPVAFTVETHHIADAGLSFDVTVYLPSTPGPYPAVAISCGSTQTAAGYVRYGERLASHGIAALFMDDPGVFTNTSDIVPNAVYLVDTWIPAMYPGVIDTAKIGLGGHSRGGAVSLLAAEHGLRGKVVAWFGVDPVDNQFLMAPRDYARTDLADLEIPTAFLGAEVTSNCAPAADSYPLLYPLAPAPKVLIVGLGAGHTQFELASACTACDLCTPSGTADGDVVLAYAIRYFTAFFARELSGDTAVGAGFEGAGGPADIAAGLVTIEGS